MTKLRRDEEVSLTKVIDVVCKIIDEVSFAGLIPLCMAR